MLILLGGQPQLTSEWDELLNQVGHRDAEPTIGVKVTARNRPEDMVDGLFGGNSAVVDDEMSLETVRDVVPPTSRVVHCSEVLGKGLRLHTTIGK